jgi:2-alkenal reductase
MNKKPLRFTALAALAMILMVLSSCSLTANTQGQTPTPPTYDGGSAPTATPEAAAPAQVPQTGGQPAPAPAAARSAAPIDASALSGLQSVLEQIYSRVGPSVVSIDVIQQATSNGLFPDQGGQTGPQEALGSGFVWDDQGHIVTNNHVVAGADQIAVTFLDGITVPAQVVGTDPNSDLAVIQVDTKGLQLQPVQMADSSQVKVGQIVVAIGNPFGEEGTMTMGIISAVGRSLPAQATASNQGTYTIPDIIQTDAPINPGNSGGVLVNVGGEVIGVTAAIESATQSSAGIGFAIPSAIVQQVVPSLISTGSYQHPWLGVSGTTLDPQLAQAMNLPASQRGVLVIDVTPGSPAEQAGLRPSQQQVTIQGLQALVGGDVIVAVDGQEIRSFDKMVAYLERSTKVGQTIELTVLRDGKKQAIRLTLEARPGGNQGP